MQISPKHYDYDNSDNVCHLCGEPDYTLDQTVNTYEFSFTFQRCRCGLIKQTPMPNEAFFKWFFNSELFFSAKKTKKDRIWGFYDYFKDENCRLATSKRRYRLLSKFFGNAPTKIMKIGPSTGTFLHVAKQHGHKAIGCDISTKFTQYAADNYDVHIDNGRFERMDYAAETFDTILLFNVIENVPNLFEFMAAIQEKIKLGGHFILNHVDMQHNFIARLQGRKYFMYRPPICYMLGSTVLEKILKRYGFEVEATYRDIRYMHLEKIFTLLHWNLPLKLFKWLRLHRIPFPIYAYPSRITVAKRVS